MKKLIILFGPPGAGKGTQAELLADKLGLYLFETSKLLEASFKKTEGLSADSEARYVEADGQKYDMLEEKKKWESGDLNSPPFVAQLVKEKIKELHDLGENLVIAGSPRTMYEAERLTPFLKELYGLENIKLLLIEISPKETIFRNSHRKICELMRHPILYNEETEKLTLCPLDGSKLVRREGLDDPESIKIRLEKYKERTFPVLEYLEKEGIEVKKINGEQSVADVFGNIMERINTNL